MFLRARRDGGKMPDNAGNTAEWSTGVLRGRTCQTCRTSRTRRLVCSVPLDNNKTGSLELWRKHRMLVKNRRQAEHPPRSGYLTTTTSRLSGEQPDDRRHSSDVILPNKIPPSGGTSAATAAASRMLRGSATICAPLQRRQSVTCAVYSRRDDRAMMTKKERGDVNLRSRDSPLFF